MLGTSMCSVVATEFAMQEGERVMETFQKQLHLPVTRIDDSKRMLGLLKVRETEILACLSVRLLLFVFVFLFVCLSVCLAKCCTCLN